MGDTTSNMQLTRRQILGAGLAGLFCASPVSAWAARQTSGERVISLQQMHTGEKLSTVYWCEGQYVREALNDINNILRDHRSDEVAMIDPSLLDLLYDVQERVGTSKPIEVYSAYRSPKTNALLRRRSRGVARRSFHMRGQAVDVRVPGLSPGKLYRLARGLKKGGVGYYGRSGFVHLDTGPVRFWRG